MFEFYIASLSINMCKESNETAVHHPLHCSMSWKLWVFMFSFLGGFLVWEKKLLEREKKIIVLQIQVAPLLA